MKFHRIGFWPYLAVIAALLMMAKFAGSFSGLAVPTSGEGRGRLIVIDPGHGGEDGGATTRSGVRESDEGWGDTLYSAEKPIASSPVSLTWIPYYAWANREPGEMRVWIRK